MKIQVLADSVVNKIAAGEVVDRPVSVVRELVDNSVDSGADSITISLENGGRTAITVVDTGCGMSRDDALLAFERHATSKIVDAADLAAIATYGFRGEALASIAAVSAVRLHTRAIGEAGGTAIDMRGGVLRKVESVATPTGTRIEIRNLFFNVPARKKFLRQQATEERRIKSWLTRFSLANPGIHFRLCFDERDVLVLPPATDFESRARRLIRGSSVPVCQDGPVSVRGLIGHPSLAQYDSGSLAILVNGRVVSDPMLIKAIKEGFQSTLKEREVPTGCLAVSLDPAAVDVNVHPQKSEVRFLHPAAVFETVRESVFAATREFRRPLTAFVSETGFAQRLIESPDTAVRPVSEKLAFTEAGSATADSHSFATSPLPGGGVTENRHPDHARESIPAALPFRFSELRYIGQALQCYLLCEGEGRLVVIDMHAAHERVNFNLVREGFCQQTVSSQQLLMPVSIQLSPQACDTLERESPFLEQFGFELDRFADDSVVVRAVPGMLIDSDIVEFVKHLAGHDVFSSVGGALNERIDAMAARIACHASIRSGYAIKRDEVYALFAQLDSHDFSAACPHGRPVVVTFSEQAVEKWFGRDR